MKGQERKKARERENEPEPLGSRRRSHIHQTILQQKLLF